MTGTIAMLAQNPVHALLRQLEDAVGRDRPDAVAANDLAPLVRPALAAAEWTGTDRQVSEALPHLGIVEDALVLRAVLLRLGVLCEPVEASPAAIGAAHLPCLIVGAGERDACLVAGGDADGAVLAWQCGETDPATLTARELPRGVVYRLRLRGEADLDGSASREGWLAPTARTLLPQITRIAGLSFIVNTLAFASPLFALLIYDFAIASAAIDTVLGLSAGALAAVLGELALRRRRAHAIAYLGARLDALISTATFRKVLSLPLGMTETAGLSAQLARFRQFQVGRTLLGGSLVATLADVPFTILSIAVLFALGGPLGFVVIAAALALVALMAAAQPAIAERARETADMKTRTDTLILEIATKIETLRDTGTEDLMRRRASDHYARYAHARFRGQKLEARLAIVAQGIVNLAGAAVLGLGAVAAMNGAISTGALIAMMVIAWRPLAPIQSLALSLGRLRQIIATLRQIDALMRMRGERAQSESQLSRPAVAGALQLRDACFRYPGRQELALKSVSIELEPGRLVAVTGPAGSGKSTLIKVMLGLYPPQAGMVASGGIDLRQLNLAELRQSAAYVGQHPALFHGTLAQNLRLTTPDATDAELLAALAAFGIAPPHPLLPEGLETRLGDWARQQSGAGLRQRVALASAFVRAKPIILLDGPEQHLDREGDAALISVLERRKGSAAILLVTQRPSYMRLADTVIGLRDGAIEMRGRPAEILPRLLAPPRPLDKAVNVS